MTPSTFVGLLLTADALEAVQYRQEGGQLHVECHHRLRAETPLLDADGVPCDAGALRALLVRFWEETGLTSREVVLGVGGRKAIARTAVLPALSAAQLPGALRDEAEQFAGLHGESPSLDYFTLDADGEHSTVFFAAVAQRVLASYQEVFAAAKLTLKAVEPGSYASARALAHLQPEQTAPWAGVVLQSGRVVFMSWSGTRLRQWRESHVEPWESGNAASRARWITSELTRLADGQAPTVVVAGRDLVESAQLADDFERFGALRAHPAGLVEWGQRLPQAALEGVSPAALGLALHGLESRLPALDLQRLAPSAPQRAASPGQPAAPPGAEAPPTAPLPTAESAQPMPAPSLAGALTAAALVFFLGLSGSAAFGAGVAAWNARIEDRLPALTAQGQALEAQYAELSAEAAQIHRLLGSAPAVPPSQRFLGQLNSLLPAEAWLTSIASPTRERLVLRGEATSKAAPLALTTKLAEFIEVGQVRILELRRTRRGHFRFAVEARLVPPPAPAVP